MLRWQTQVELVKAVLEYPEVARDLGGVLRGSHFENPALGWIVKTIAECYERSGLPPTQGQIEQGLSHMEPHMEAACLSLLPDVLSAQVPTAEWAIEHGRAFAAHQEAVILAGELPRLAKEGLYAQAKHRLEEVLHLASPPGLILCAEETQEAVRARHTRTGRYVSTGIRRLDGFLQGGLERGRVGHVEAKKGGGKSHALVSLGASALLQGYRVHHVTYEMSVEETHARYDRSLVGLPSIHLLEHLPKLLPILQEAKTRLSILDARRRGHGVTSIEASLDRLRGGKEPDLIIIDYLQRIHGAGLAGQDVAGARRAQLGSISHDLATIAAERDAALWTAWQANRGGILSMRGKDKTCLGIEHYAEAMEAAYPASVIMSLNRSITEEATRYGRLYLAENRDGPSGKVIEAVMDWSCSRLRDAMDEQPEPEKKEVA